MKKLKQFGLTAAAYLLPVVALAQVEEIGDLPELFNTINRLINTFIPFLVGLAVLIIIWGVFNYIAGAGDEEKRAQAKQYVVWGVVGVFIMLSIWGLVSILANTFALRKDPLPLTEYPGFLTDLEIEGGGPAGPVDEDTILGN